jgi:hypothetical protein
LSRLNEIQEKLQAGWTRKRIFIELGGEDFFSMKYTQFCRYVSMFSEKKHNDFNLENIRKTKISRPVRFRHNPNGSNDLI